jgi:hypothetical protein
MAARPFTKHDKNIAAYAWASASLFMAKPCELCDLLRAELASARVEATALQRDRAARLAGANVVPRQRATWFKEAMTRWVIAASNLECHFVDHG